MTEPKPTLPNPAPSTRAPEHDKWCPARMADFLRALAATHSVADAARAVVLSRQGA